MHTELTSPCPRDIVVKNQYLRNFLLYGLGFAALSLVIWWNWYPSTDGRSPGLVNVLAKQFHWGSLLIGAILFLAGLLIQFVRWHALVVAQGLPFTFFNSVRLGLIGFFFNSVLPAGSIGGDLVKATFIAREQQRRTIAVSTVLIDRAMGLWGLLWLAFLAGAAFWALGSQEVAEEPTLRLIILTLGGILAATVCAWLLLGLLPQWRADRFAGRLGRIPKIGHSAAEFWRAIWIYRLKRRTIGAALVLSVMAHVCFVIGFYFSAQIFRDPGKPLEIPSLSQHFLIVPICSASEAFVPLPGGMGAGEAMYGGFYSKLGFSADYGIAACFARRIIIILGWSLIGYFIYLQMKPALRATGDRDKVDAVEPSLDGVNSPGAIHLPAEPVERN
jgi:glycosyltransferase 2 family protein